jgi:hypothetical protein
MAMSKKNYVLRTLGAATNRESESERERERGGGGGGGEERERKSWNKEFSTLRDWPLML